MAIKRFNVSLSENVLEYLDSEAERVGLSRSAMIAMVVEYYRTDRASSEISLTEEQFQRLRNTLEKDGV